MTYSGCVQRLGVKLTSSNRTSVTSGQILDRAQQQIHLIFPHNKLPHGMRPTFTGIPSSHQLCLPLFTHIHAPREPFAPTPIPPRWEFNRRRPWFHLIKSPMLTWFQSTLAAPKIPEPGNTPSHKQWKLALRNAGREAARESTSLLTILVLWNIYPFESGKECNTGP